MRNLLIAVAFFPLLLHAQSISIYTASDSVCSAVTVVFTAAATGSATPHYRWERNGIATGTDSAALVTSTISNGDTIKCLLVNNAGDTVYAASDSIVMTITPLPDAGAITGSGSVCAGSSVVLSESVSGGAWSASNTYASVSGGMVTGNQSESMYGSATSIDTIDYVVINGCGTDTASMAIVVNGPPDDVFSVPVSELCVDQGETLLFGEEDFPSDIYTSNYCVALGNYFISGSIPGLDTLYYVFTNACGADTSTQAIQVVPRPEAYATVTFAEVCAEATTTVTVSVSGSAQFHFTVSNADVRVTPGNLIMGVYPGMDTLTLFTDACNASVATSTVVVTVAPNAPPIVIPGALCVGDSIIVFDSSAGGTWSNKHPELVHLYAGPIEAGTGIMKGLQTGTDTVFYTTANGCSVSTTVTVSQGPGPISGGDSLLCAGDVLRIADTGKGTWSAKATGPIVVAPVVDTILIKCVSAGVGTISYTYPNGCYVTKQIGITDCSKDENIFPSPVTDQLTIEANTYVYHTYHVTNAAGRKVTNGTLNGPLTQIDVRAWPAGIYMVRLLGPYSTHVTKVLKE